MKEVKIIHKIAGIVSQSVIQHNLHQNHIPIKKQIPANESELMFWHLGLCILNRYLKWFLDTHSLRTCIVYLVFHSTLSVLKIYICVTILIN